eukprot:359723-Pyramimonas_sp.AAC.1
MGRRRHADCATGPLGGVPYVATECARGVAKFGGNPHGATKRVRSVPTWGGAAMRTAPVRH